MASQAGPSMFSASPSRNSLHDASATVDDLTRSLANLSRATTPDLPDGENQESEYTRAWLAVKSKLESQLVLSAEIGQALLQRHEAFVRKVQRDRESRHQPSVDEASIDELQEFDDEPRSRVELEARVAELVQENAVLEKRLNVALLNAEVAESANKELLDEVQDLRSTVNRLSTENARSVGWETRLRNAIQERDDFRQERDAEGQRARIAESRLVALGDKNAELRAQMRQLTDSVDQNYRHRQELSEEILHDARSRLAKLQAYKQTASSVDNDEITGILESLVADNEALVQSNNELQCMLADTREELNTLQEEAEEHRAAASFSPYDDTFSNRPSSRAYRRPGSRMTYGTAPGPISPLSVAMSARRGHRHKRSLSSDIPKHEFEPLTPQTNIRALSPDPFDAPGPTFQSMGPPPSEDHTLVGGDLDEHASGLTRTSPNRRKQVPSHQHQGVQTDAWTSSLFPDVPGSQLLSDFSSSLSPNDGLSESSSLTDNPSTLKSLLDRISQLLGRMTQADALSLTSRLKRQNIVGADVSYISRSTVESIVADVTNLRGALRSALEDDKFTTVCSRGDLKVILKLFRELFRELGTLRIMLNDIVLDPSLAPKVREMVFHPQKAEQQAAAKAAAAAASAAAATTAAGWMAPLSKLFGGVSAGTPSQPIRPPSRSVSRPAPKAPVLPSASTTTVNVEFTPKGARATTESSPRTLGPSILPNRFPSSFAATSSTPSRQVSSSVMGIFAGAPRTDPNADPWVVVKASSKLRPKTPASGSNALAPPRPDASRGERRVSRNVEAMLDADETQALNGQLLERTLRPRGLSDSSIRSTFLQHGELPTSSAVNAAPPGRQGVFQAFTQRVSAAVAGTTSLENRAPSPSMESLHRRVESGGTLPRALSPGLARLLPEMSWGMGDEVVADPDEYVAGHRRRGDMPWMRGARGREI